VFSEYKSTVSVSSASFPWVPVLVGASVSECQFSVGASLQSSVGLSL
jgi:hypothetical protein